MMMKIKKKKEGRTNTKKHVLFRRNIEISLLLAFLQFQFYVQVILSKFFLLFHCNINEQSYIAHFSARFN